MPDRQLHFFAHPKPLLSIFDAAFFKSIPRVPGVYVMTDKAERVVYVGQSGNLRHRLLTYKNCNPDHLSRKVIRLIHQVQKISWEICDSIQHARLRENALLRLHRPKFNVVNVYPRAYAFLGVKCESSRLSVWLTRDQKAGREVYGAFKGLGSQTFCALIRSVWAALNKPLSTCDFPCGILSGAKVRQFTFEADGEAMSSLPGLMRDYLGGISSALVDWLRDSLPHARNISPFQSIMHEADLDVLSQFFFSGPRRNYNLAQQYGFKDGIILQEQLDDLIVTASQPSDSQRLLKYSEDGSATASSPQKPSRKADDNYKAENPTTIRPSPGEER